MLDAGFHRACVALTAVAGVVGAQSPGTADSVPRYSRVTSVRELSGGRVLVSDAGLSRVDVLNAELRFLRAAARQGEGPLEYGSSDLLLVAGDSTLVVDDIGSSLLVLDPEARPVAKRGYRRPQRGERALVSEVRGSDRAGRLYFTGFRTGANPTSPRDSAPLLRWTKTTDAIDTVTWIRVPVPGLRPSETNPDSLMNARPDPFEWRDVWSVAPDGRVVVVRGDDYHVEWIEGDGRRTIGPALEIPRARVSAEDIQRIRDTKFTIATPEGPRTISAATGARVSNVKSHVAEGTMPRVDPEGRVWVERSRETGENRVTYDLFDRSGSAVLTVQVAHGARVAGFGAQAVYATRPVDGGRVEVTKGRRPPQ